MNSLVTIIFPTENKATLFWIYYIIIKGNYKAEDFLKLEDSFSSYMEANVDEEFIENINTNEIDSDSELTKIIKVIMNNNVGLEWYIATDGLPECNNIYTLII